MIYKAKSSVIAAVLAGSFSFFQCHDLEAFKLNPMMLELTPKKNQGFFNVTNSSDGEEVVLIFGANRIMDEWGKETKTESDDFIIYPSHLVMKPGEQRMVRVIWKGKEKLSAEKNYRIIFEQQMTSIPKTEKELAEKEARMAVGIGIKYETSVYVAPDDKAASDIQVSKFSIIQEEGKDYLLCEVENKGNRHKFLTPKTLEVSLKLDKATSQGETWYSLPDQLLQGLSEGVNVFANQKRMIKLPITGDVPRNIISVNIAD